MARVFVHNLFALRKQCKPMSFRDSPRERNGILSRKVVWIGCAVIALSIVLYLAGFAPESREEPEDYGGFRSGITYAMNTVIDMMAPPPANVFTKPTRMPDTTSSMMISVVIPHTILHLHRPGPESGNDRHRGRPGTYGGTPRGSPC